MSIPRRKTYIFPKLWFVQVLFVILMIGIWTRPAGPITYLASIFFLWIIFSEGVEHLAVLRQNLTEEGICCWIWFKWKKMAWNSACGAMSAPKGVRLFFDSARGIQEIYISFDSYEDPKKLMEFIHEKIPKSKELVVIPDEL